MIMIEEETELESRRIVLKETAVVAAGVVICLGIMLAVYALLGYFSTKVLLGGIIGALLAILNFFFMAANASLAMDKAVNQDVKGGKSLMKMSYMFRLAAIFLILFACVKSGLCDALASVLPLLFVRPVITIAEFFKK